MKNTLSSSLDAIGWRLSAHYSDPRANGYRHKIELRSSNVNEHSLNEIDALVHQYAPEANCVGHNNPGSSFQWATYIWRAPTAAAPGIGTPLSDRLRSKHHYNINKTYTTIVKAHPELLDKAKKALSADLTDPESWYTAINDYHKYAESLGLTEAEANIVWFRA